MKDLSIVIPAYNEAKRIVPTIQKFNAYLAKTHYSYEIIVADDGSTDDTINVIKNLEIEIPELRLVRCETNKGKGQAVRIGMLAGEGKIRLFSDADGATPIEELPNVLAPIENKEAKISIGSRYLAQSKIAKSQPFYRRIWSRLANLFVQRLLLPGIVDPNCGFKAFDGKTAQFLFAQCTVNEWSFDLEVLALARKHDLTISQIPVKWVHDEASKGKLRHLPQEIKNLYTIRKRLNLSI
ncbi:MAG: dolichyl-phosphate beta-glucosyltransferase [Crocinitomix sp.]|jgi:dolichyl-phosphate beta-glucosyltransferase